MTDTAAGEAGRFPNGPNSETDIEIAESRHVVDVGEYAHTARMYRSIDGENYWRCSDGAQSYAHGLGKSCLDSMERHTGADVYYAGEPQPPVAEVGSPSKLDADIEALGAHYGPVKVADAACRIARRPDLAGQTTTLLMAEAIKRLAGIVVDEGDRHREIVSELGSQLVLARQQLAQHEQTIARLQQRLERAEAPRPSEKAGRDLAEAIRAPISEPRQ